MSLRSIYRPLLATVILLTLLGCMSGDSGGAIFVASAIQQSSSIEGSGVIGSIYVGAFPWTYAIKWSGTGTMTLQYPAKPHIVLEGDLVWEPVVPEHSQLIQAAVARGEISVSHSGYPVALSRTGTIHR